MLTRTTLLISLALLPVLAACPEEEPPLIEVHALPQELGDIDVSYIPFEYDPIGSYAYHMPLLAMELAAAGIPSQTAQVANCDGNWTLNAPNGDKWGHHDALAVNHDGQTMIVDPVLSSDLLTIDEFNDAFDANSVVVVGGPALGHRPCTNTVADPVPAKVEDMPHVDFANVMIYCAYMKRFYRDIGGDYTAREQRLVSRVRELTLAMNELGLLDLWDENDPEFQLVKREPYCPRPIPVK